MEILAKIRMEMLLVMVAASAVLFAQSSGPDKPQNPASVQDARQIVGLSVAATERSWQARNHYIYIERDEDRRLDSLGKVKSENVDVTRMILVNGARFEQLMEHNGNLPSVKEQRKSDENLEKLKHETPDERAAWLRKDQEDRSFLEEVLQAFDFQLVGRRDSRRQAGIRAGGYATPRLSRGRQVRQDVVQGGGQPLGRQAGLRVDQGRRRSNAVVLDGIIRGPRAAWLAHHPGPDVRR